MQSLTRTFMHQIVSLLLPAAVLLSGVSADDDNLSVRIYNVAQLLDTSRDAPYQPEVGSLFSPQPSVTSGGGSCGLTPSTSGETTSATTNGQGYFRVDDDLDNVATDRCPQAGDRGLFVPSGSGAIESLIHTFVAPESWFDGDLPVEMKRMGNLLIVRHTTEVHQQIDGLLDMLSAARQAERQTFLLQAWWIPVTAESRGQLARLLHNSDTSAVDLDRFCSSAGGATVSLNCRAGSTSHIASGEQRPFVRGTVPVVGTGAVGHQAVSSVAQTGIVLEVTPVATGPASDRYRLDLRSAWSDGNLNLLNDRTTEWAVQQPRLETAVLQTSCSVTPGRPVVSGAFPLSAASRWRSQNPEIRELVHVVLLIRSTDGDSE